MTKPNAFSTSLSETHYSVHSDIEFIGCRHSKMLKRPLFLASIQAGFPSPADDFIDKSLDLNEYLIRHPTATFFVRVCGESMIEAGIFPHDLLIVDRAEEPKNNSIVIAAVNGELTVKRIFIEDGILFLTPDNPSYSRIMVTEEMDFEIWGVVTYVVHKL